MKLLYLNHNVSGRGTYVRAANLAREVVAAGHDVTLVTTSEGTRRSGREREWCGVRVVEAPDLFTGAARTGWDPWNTAWRMRRLAGERFDLVHAFDSRPAVILPALAARRRTGVPLVLDWADWWGRGGTIMERSGWLTRTFFGPVETWFEEGFRVGATAHTAIAETLRQRCAALGVDPDRILWLPNGCVPPEDAPPSAAAARRQLGLDNGPLLLHLGVAFPADAAFLFEAFRRVRATVPGTRLALVGPFRSPVPPDLEGSVIRTGYVEDSTLKLWLAAADVGLLVLRDNVASRGRWPAKLSDYLSGGVPLVITRVGPAAEFAAAAGAAVLSAAEPAAFGDRITDLLHDADSRARLGTAGRRLAAGELGWAAVAARLLRFYQRWLHRQPGGGRNERPSADAVSVSAS
jgi:glycosyltransferase involved in cell wall biosynthesis